MWWWWVEHELWGAGFLDGDRGGKDGFRELNGGLERFLVGRDLLLLVELRLNRALVQRLLVELLRQLLRRLWTTRERRLLLLLLRWWLRTGLWLREVRDEVGLSVMLEVWVVNGSSHRTQTLLCLLGLMAKVLLLLLLLWMVLVMVLNRLPLIDERCLGGQLLRDGCVHLETGRLRLEVLLRTVVHLVGWREGETMLLHIG